MVRVHRFPPEGGAGWSASGLENRANRKVDGSTPSPSAKKYRSTNERGREMSEVVQWNGSNQSEVSKLLDDDDEFHVNDEDMAFVIEYFGLIIKIPMGTVFFKTQNRPCRFYTCTAWDHKWEDQHTGCSAGW